MDDASGDILVSLLPGALETSGKDGSLKSETKSRPDSYSHLRLRKINRLGGTDIATFEFEGDYPDYKAGQYAFFPLEKGTIAKQEYPVI